MSTSKSLHVTTDIMFVGVIIYQPGILCLALAACAESPSLLPVLERLHGLCNYLQCTVSVHSSSFGRDCGTMRLYRLMTLSCLH